MQLLSNYHAELVGKYSFVDRVEIQGTKFIIFYRKNGKLEKTFLPIRATIPQLEEKIKWIRIETGVSVHGKAHIGDVFVTV